MSDKPVYCTICGQYLIDTTVAMKTTQQFYDESSIETGIWLETHIGRHHQSTQASRFPTYKYLSFRKPKVKRA